MDFLGQSKGSLRKDNHVIVVVPATRGVNLG
jgi:hypothetical protein